MEHIIQFGVSIDDKAIEERATERASRELTDALKKTMFDLRFGNPVGLSEFMQGIFDDWMQEHKEELLNMASEKFAEKLSRSKAGRELLKKYEEN